MDHFALALVESADFAVQVTTAENVELAASEPWRMLVASHPDDQYAWLDLIHFEDRDRVWQELESDRLAQRASRCGFRIADADQQYRPWSVSRTPILDGEDLLGWLTVLTPSAQRSPDMGAGAQSRRDLDAPQDVARIGAWDWKLPSEHLWWSDEFYRILGLAPQSVQPTYEDLLDRVHPDDRATVESQLAAAAAGVRRFDLRHRIVRPDGTHRHVRQWGRVTIDGGGSPVRVIGTVLDVTDEALQDRAQEAAVAELQAGEARFRHLAEATSDIVYRTNADQMIQWISPAAERLLRWAPEELVGQSSVRLIHPDDLPRSSDVRSAPHAGEPFPQSIVRVTTATGSARFMSVTSRALTTEEGERDGVLVGLHDVHDLVLARREAEAVRDRLQSTMQALLDPFAILDLVHADDGSLKDLRFTDVNDALVRYSGLPREQLIGSRLTALFPNSSEHKPVPQLLAILAAGRPLALDDFEYTHPGSDRKNRYDIRAVAVGDHVAMTFRDVTERFRTRQELAASEELYRLVATSISDAIARFDDHGRITWVSPSYLTLSGYIADEVIGRPWVELLDPSDNPDQVVLGRLAVMDGSPVRVRHICADGGRRWVEVSTGPFRHADGTREGYFSVLRDVQAQVQIEQLLEHEMGHDPMTGLANRRLALDRIRRAVDASSSSSEIRSLLCIGVDRITQINEALTYQGGDQLLTAVAGRIVQAVANPDLVARIAGDEFAVLLGSGVAAVQATAVADQICATVRNPVTVGGHTLTPTVSIGIATTENTCDPEELVRAGILAMREAKAAGRDRWAFADPFAAEQAQQALILESELRTALPRGEVACWLMPVVRFRDGQTTGYEALARWIRPGGEVLEPGRFLPVAERSGLIVDVDFAILRQAVGLLPGLPAGTTMAVNVASSTLDSADYVQRFHRALTGLDADYSRLILEFTETALVEVTDRLRETMQAIADLGVRWYVDDFGTGYSSISHLRDLPVSGVKLDLSFTAAMTSGSAKSRGLAQGLAGLADGLGLDTVAEGVETREQAEILAAQGWQRGQGWLFGKATPPDGGPESRRPPG